MKSEWFRNQIDLCKFRP